MCLTAVPWKPAQPFLRYLLPVRAGPAFPTAAAHHPAAAAPAQPRVRRQSLSAADCFRVQKLPMRVLARRGRAAAGGTPALEGRARAWRGDAHLGCARGLGGSVTAVPQGARAGVPENPGATPAPQGAGECSRKPGRHAGTSGRAGECSRKPRRHRVWAC